MSEWKSIMQPPPEGRYVISDGRHVAQGMFTDGTWYADDAAPIFSEDIRFYMVVLPPGQEPEQSEVQRLQERTTQLEATIRLMRDTVWDEAVPARLSAKIGRQADAALSPQKGETQSDQ